MAATIKDPITGRVYEIERTISGRALEEFLSSKTKDGPYRGSTTERCALHGGGAHDGTLPTHNVPRRKGRR